MGFLSDLEAAPKIFQILILFFFIYSVRIRVGRSIDGFGLSPGITREQRLAQETLMSHAFAKLEGDLAGKYFPLLGMNEADRQQLVSQIFSLWQL